jgi:SAM-dependent methyltransferase
MASKQQYGPGYAKSQVRHHEWRTVENSAGHLLPHLEAMIDADAALRVLDVGAGSGTISASLAAYLPRNGASRLVATDISEEILGRARQVAEEQGVADRVEFRVADVFALPFADGTFDIVHAHQVLCHLDRPVDALAEMLRVVKPAAGILALRESDLHTFFFWPELPPLLRFADLQAQIIAVNGGSDKGGRQLLSWALQAGVPRERIDATYGTWCYATDESREAWSESMHVLER